MLHAMNGISPWCQMSFFPQNLTNDLGFDMRRGAEYVMGLNYDNHPLEGFVVSTNMLAQLAVNPVDMGSTNFWDGMMSLYESQGCSPQTGFLLNAALVLADQKRWEEVIPYTNSLPSFAIEIFLENIAP